MPKNWKTYKLEDAVEKLIDYRGKTPTKTQDGIPLITAKVIKSGRIETPNEFIAEEQYSDWMTRGIPEYGDVVLTTEAPLGEVAQINTRERIALAQRVITLRGKKDIVDNTYLKYFLQSPIGQANLKAKETGSTVTGIKQSQLREVEIYAPDYKSQTQIASILSSLDDKIELNLQMNQTLEAMAQAIFKEWFVDYKFPGSTGKLVNGLPKGWRKGSIYELIEVIYGFPFKSTLFNQKEEGSGLIRIRDLKNNFAGFYTTELADNRYLIQPGDVLAGMDAEFIPSIWLGEPSWLNQRVCKFKPKFDFVNELFILSCIKPLLERSQYGKVGTTVIHLGKGDIDMYEILIPHENQLKQVSELLEPIHKRLIEIEKENRTLTQIRDSLLPNLMNGTIEVKA
jgi:type I restriction enzyme S subunit